MTSTSDYHFPIRHLSMHDSVEWYCAELEQRVPCDGADDVDAMHVDDVVYDVVDEVDQFLDRMVEGDGRMDRETVAAMPKAELVQKRNPMRSTIRKTTRKEK